MAEPSAINPEREVRIYGSRDRNHWNALLSFHKDRWPMRWFQYGNAFLPDGNNTTEFLAVTTVAIEGEDHATSLYALR
jgi:hypothetical protein